MPGFLDVRVDTERRWSSVGEAPAAGPPGCAWRPFLRGRCGPLRAGTLGSVRKGGRVPSGQLPFLPGGGGSGPGARRGGDERESVRSGGFERWRQAGAPAEPRALGKPLGCWEALRARERDRVRVRVRVRVRRKR